MFSQENQGFWMNREPLIQISRFFPVVHLTTSFASHGKSSLYSRDEVNSRPKLGARRGPPVHIQQINIDVQWSLNISHMRAGRYTRAVSCQRDSLTDSLGHCAEYQVNIKKGGR